MNYSPPKKVQAGLPDIPVEILVFSDGWSGREEKHSTAYKAPEGTECPAESSEACRHPSCDATYGHADEEDSACPWHSGNCWYCDYGDCQKSHPKCDGLTYDQRNKF